MINGSFDEELDPPKEEEKQAKIEPLKLRPKLLEDADFDEADDPFASYSCYTKKERIRRCPKCCYNMAKYTCCYNMA